jgi:hypothetical protein
MHGQQNINIVLAVLCRPIAATGYSCGGSRYVQLILISKSQQVLLKKLINKMDFIACS